MQFWKSSKIMHATENNTAVWNEATEMCMNRIWQKLRPEVCSNSGNGEQNIDSNIVQLVNETRLEEVDDDDV